ncbi:MAG: PAS domain S-box protein [Deltaproteobacteria bacterium]|nr:PAS domain S-box protein [Deltaproteobacteria bacterium]
MMKPIIHRLGSMSLKWKLMIPFLFFAFTGTTLLVLVSLTSQQQMIKDEEKKEISLYYDRFLEKIYEKKTLALSLATLIAENPEVQRLLAMRDREALNRLLDRAYRRLAAEYDIEQFHFHIPPATSFLRLHDPKAFGDDMGLQRKTIPWSLKHGTPVGGLEWGKAGFGIRGVVPVFYDGKTVGTVEIGHSLGKAFLKRLQRRWGVDLTIYKTGGANSHRPLAGTGSMVDDFPENDQLEIDRIKQPTILIAPEGYSGKSFLFGPVKDFSGTVVAVVQISRDRSEIRNRLDEARHLMVLVGLAGICMSFFLTYLVAIFFIHPIESIVKEAQDIAAGDRESQLEPRRADEIGALTQALNTMLAALKRRQQVIKDYARTLEGRVQERTTDLVASEEKYRTLVENVPLIVYRILEDGTTEFINSYLTEILGYSIEEAVGDKKFWREKIIGKESMASGDVFEACFQRGEVSRVERSVKDKNGRRYTFIDHAIPAKDPHDRVPWVDGIMLDITELKKLQARALRSEEIRVLGEISAGMAHEIRNPLITTGGFARRLRDALPENDPHRKLAQIIVEEVSRLEHFLKVLLSSISPFDLSLTEVDVTGILEFWEDRLQDVIEERRIRVVMEHSENIPKIRADKEKLTQAFGSIFKHAAVSMPSGEDLHISTSREGDQVMVTFRHNVVRLSEDDLEKFFFPHVENEPAWTVEDLPLSKIIIHRHGGTVDLAREGEGPLIMSIRFPLKGFH